MHIRKAKIEDYNQIIKLYNELYDTEKVFDINLSKTYDISDKQRIKIEKRIKSRKEIFLVAEDKEKIIGLIDGYILDNNHHIEKVGYLDHLCVKKGYRNLGVANKLIDDFSVKMKNKNVSYLKLNAFENNIPAINLYKKLGFKEYSIFYQKKI